MQENTLIPIDSIIPYLLSLKKSDKQSDVISLLCAKKKII